MFNLRSVKSLATLIAVAAILGGCASVPPAELGTAPADVPSQAAVQRSPAEYQGKTVRWGGEILDVRNECIELVPSTRGAKASKFCNR